MKKKDFVRKAVPAHDFILLQILYYHSNSKRFPYILTDRRVHNLLDYALGTKNKNRFAHPQAVACPKSYEQTEVISFIRKLPHSEIIAVSVLIPVFSIMATFAILLS